MTETFFEPLCCAVLAISIAYMVYQNGYRAGLRRSSEIDEKVAIAIRNQSE